MKRLLLFLLFASGLFGQTPALVTGKVFDSGGNVATSGYVQFDIQPSASAVQFFVLNVGSIAPPSVQCPINGSGLISCNVWGNDVISPANTTYQVTFAPGGNITNVVNSECISGTTYNLNSPKFCPNVLINPQQATIRANPFETNVIAPSPDVYTVGSPQSFWAAGYFDNLFGKAIFVNGVPAGTVSSVGLTLPSWLTVVGSPVTTVGTFAVTPTTGQTSHQVIGTCGGLTSFQPCALTSADLPGATGSVTSIATTLPLVGGPITTTGTLSCPTCVIAPVNPGAGVGHFAGGTQNITSSLVANADLVNSSTTVNGQTCTLGGSCTITSVIIFRTATGGGCTTQATSNSTCDVVLTWQSGGVNTPFADTNYVFGCSMVNPNLEASGGNGSTGQAQMTTVRSFTASTITVVAQNERSTAATPTATTCVGVHI